MKSKVWVVDIEIGYYTKSYPSDAVGHRMIKEGVTVNNFNHRDQGDVEG